MTIRNHASHFSNLLLKPVLLSSRAKNKSEGIRHFSKHYNKPAKKFQDYRVPVEFLRSFTPQIILKIGKIELKNMISDIQGVPTSLDFSIHFLNPNNNVCLMVRQNCQNWHLSVVLLCFLWCLAMLMTVCFKATFRRNSQLVMGRTLGKKRLLRTELRSPVAAALTHSSASQFPTANLSSVAYETPCV